MNKKEKKIIEIVKNELKKWGIVEENKNDTTSSYDLISNLMMFPTSLRVDDDKHFIRGLEDLKEQNIKFKKLLDLLEEKLSALLEHLKIEYFKKEIKETNGHTKSYIEKGFRKIKKVKKSKKSSKIEDDEEDYED